MNKDTVAVILAAGKSTRTYPLTLTRPKPLLKVMNKTLLEHNLDQLKDLVDDVIVVVGFKKEMIMERFGMEYKGMKLTYVVQKDQTGTGSALLQAKDYIKDRFIMLYGDDLYSRVDLKACLDQKYSVLAQKVSNPECFGIFKADGKYVESIIEKPQEFISDLANCGAFVLDKTIFDMNLDKSDRGEFEATDYLTGFAKENKVEIVEVKDYWFPIGYPWSLLDANAHFLKDIETKIEGTVEEGVTINGKVILGKGSVLMAGTYIEGNVIIGKDCKIGPNTYLRKSIAIGDDCRIGAQEVKESIFFDHCRCDHFGYIGDCVFGESTHVGAGVVFANLRHDHKNHRSMVNGELIDTGRRKLGTITGDKVDIGIHSSFYPGRKMWPGTFTYPAEVVKRDVIEQKLDKK